MHKGNPMHALSWLARRRFLSLTRREHDWVFSLGDDAQIVVESLWRLLDGGRVRVTSEDHGQQFDQPAPMDAAAEVNRRIAGKLLTQVDLREGTLDLDLHLEGGGVVQIIPGSSGYEAWNVRCPTGQFIAVGGGELTILGSPPLSS